MYRQYSLTIFIYTIETRTNVVAEHRTLSELAMEQNIWNGITSEKPGRS